MSKYYHFCLSFFSLNPSKMYSKFCKYQNLDFRLLIIYICLVQLFLFDQGFVFYVAFFLIIMDADFLFVGDSQVFEDWTACEG